MKEQSICSHLRSYQAEQQSFWEKGRTILWTEGKPTSQTDNWLSPPPAHIVIEHDRQGFTLNEGTVLIPPMFEEIVASYYTQEGYFPKGVSSRYMSLVFKEGDKYGLASTCAYPRGREDKIILIPPIYDEIAQIPWASGCYMVRQRNHWAIYTLIREPYSDGRECVFHTVAEFCPFEIKEFVGSITLGSGEDDYTYAIWGLKSSWGYWGAFMTEPTMYIPPLFDHLSIDGEEDDEYIVGWIQGQACPFPRDEYQYALMRKYTQQHPTLKTRYDQLQGL